MDQDVVDAMVDQGLMALTGTSTVADAWAALLPSYRPGQGIAIKVNFNNAQRVCDNTSGKIDALIQPVNAVIRGLKKRGVAESDIWVYDAIRWMPDRFVNGCLYNGVRFFDAHCRETAGFSSSDPAAYITFSPPAGTPAPPPTRITDVLIRATYVINMPILKRHSLAGISLGFKNHLGSVNKPGNFHAYIDPKGDYFSSTYNPLVDLFQNPHIQNKTILTIGDGLFGAKEFNIPPSPWSTFGGQMPNSLFFAVDPVAIDCVMCDFLAAEMSIPSEADDYLHLAYQAGIGIFERGDPWGSGYDQINYQIIQL